MSESEHTIQVCKFYDNCAGKTVLPGLRHSLRRQSLTRAAGSMKGVGPSVIGAPQTSILRSARLSRSTITTVAMTIRMIAAVSA